MKQIRSNIFKYAGPFFSAAIAVLVLSTHLHAAEPSFREQFIINDRDHNVEAQAILVRRNKGIIQGEIKKLVEDAMAEVVPEKRLFLLHIANTIAYMDKYWHDGDEGVIREIETLINIEIKKENGKAGMQMEWKKEEVLGNFVMKEHFKEIETAGLSPVLFPHWLHRIWFQCKVCHDDTFAMERSANNISQVNIVQGKQCGICHNGKMAFSANEQCEKCHIAGKPEGRTLHDAGSIDYEKIKSVASRIGSVWNSERLPGKIIPLDKFKFIDWLELKKRNVFSPAASLAKNADDVVRDNQILFEPDADVNNVLFDHKSHSSLIKCGTCHPAVFKEELGSNKVKMVNMSRKESCGLCHAHGGVSFGFSTCNRCHALPKGEAVKGALIRKKKN